MERTGQKSSKELEQLIAAQLRSETSELGEAPTAIPTERRLDQRISKGSGNGTVSASG